MKQKISILNVFLKLNARIIFGVHAYSWSGPGHWSPKCFTSGAILAALNIRDRIAGRRLYGEMEESQVSIKPFFFKNIS